ncbi:MAG: hypothetical protein JRN06_12560 [Nitrososphaerota archaeon]|nr:hypothetical protein [Nitrososphaerota archaeon]
MTEEGRPSEVEIHEDFLQHVEDGSRKMSWLSAVSSIVAAVLAVSYLSQLALPLTGTTSVTVSLTDPTLIATEVAVLVLALAWLYVGVSNYRFTASLARKIKAARAAEAEMERKIAG